MKKKLFAITIFIIVLCSSLFAQAKLSRYDKLPFWQIDGTDSDGNPSRLYILGTIHLADDNIYPIPDLILDAWDNSDAYFYEVSVEDVSKVAEISQKMVLASASLDRERSVLDELTEEEKEKIQERLDASTGVSLDNFAYFEPWVLSASLPVDLTNTSISAEKSYDVYFLNLAIEQDIEIRGLETAVDQLKINSYGDWDQQIQLLKDKINTPNFDKLQMNLVKAMYAAYFFGDPEVLEYVMNASFIIDINRCPAYEGYYDFVFRDRNEKWAPRINKILNKGGTSFLFAGIGHFITEDSVFEFMRKAGTLSEGTEIIENEEGFLKKNPDEYIY